MVTCAIAGKVLWVEHKTKKEALLGLLKQMRSLKIDLDKEFEDCKNSLVNCNLIINMLQELEKETNG